MRYRSETIGMSILLALQAVEREHGVSIQFEGNTGYTGNQLFKKLVITENDVSGNQVDAAEVSFVANARHFGVRASDYNRVFESYTSGGRYRLKGIKPRNRKYPFIATRLSDGKSFKFTERTVVDALGYSEVS